MVCDAFDKHLRRVCKKFETHLSKGLQIFLHR